MKIEKVDLALASLRALVWEYEAIMELADYKSPAWLENKMAKLTAEIKKQKTLIRKYGGKWESVFLSENNSTC